MTDHCSITPIAARLRGSDATERTELRTPGGLELNGSPVVGAHLTVRTRRVGTVNAAGNATTEERTARFVVAVTVDGKRVPFDPDAFSRWVGAHETGMEGYV